MRKGGEVKEVKKSGRARRTRAAERWGEKPSVFVNEEGRRSETQRGSERIFMAAREL